MDSIALYRKYRPQTFEQVIGQDHVVSALASSLAKGTPAHAYLFTGSRGTGKTTLARIIAHELGTSPSDLYEMDGASNRGIDDIRDLKENIYTMPFNSKYKVYVIDEVHMLTKEAFNALLKTLEEPPAYALFILATTELEKVPETIVSRCETYKLKKPNEAMLAEYVAKVAKAEGYEITKEDAELVALSGDGAFRDTLSTLQKVLSATEGKKVSDVVVANLVGAPTSAHIADFLTALFENDAEKAIGVIRTLEANGASAYILFQSILKRLHAMLTLRASTTMGEKMLASFSEREVEIIKTMVAKKSPVAQSKTIESFLHYGLMIKNSPLPFLPLELFVAKTVEEVSSK